MRDRAEFVMLACGMRVVAQGNPTMQREHVKHLRETAEALADELGLGGPNDTPERRGEGDPMRFALQEARDTVTRQFDELRAAKERIADLEAQVEQLTAPPTATGSGPKAGGPRGGK